MQSALNAQSWDELFGSHKTNKLLESNVLQVIAMRVDLICMDFHGKQQRQIKTAFFWSKPMNYKQSFKMIKQSYELSSKISIVNEDSLSTNSIFYKKYSRFILKALNKKVYQNYLSDMLKLENIPQKSIHSINIEILPASKRNGLTIAGKCNTINGKIRIYPKPLKFCDAFRKEYGRYLLVEYAGNRARASLIHEVLHLKYRGDEMEVRKLTKQYYSQLVKKEFPNSLKASHICKLIFAH